MTLPSISPTAIINSSSVDAMCVIYASQSSINSSLSYFIWFSEHSNLFKEQSHEPVTNVFFLIKYTKELTELLNL